MRKIYLALISLAFCTVSALANDMTDQRIELPKEQEEIDSGPFWRQFWDFWDFSDNSGGACSGMKLCKNGAFQYCVPLGEECDEANANRGADEKVN